MHFNEYQKLAMRTKAHYDSAVDQINCAALGIAGEAGEIAEIIKKHKYQGHPLDEAEVIEEAGDILWYVALLCDALGVTVGGAAYLNVLKLRERYPDGFEEERSINREE